LSTIPISGTTTNPKVGVTWEPVEGLALRGAYGTSFHAPGFFDVRQGPGLSQVVPLPVSIRHRLADRAMSSRCSATIRRSTGTSAR
jgi:hypothetical protein